MDSFGALPSNKHVYLVQQFHTTNVDAIRYTTKLNNLVFMFFGTVLKKSFSRRSQTCSFSIHIVYTCCGLFLPCRYSMNCCSCVLKESRLSDPYAVFTPNMSNTFYCF